jgi:GxxExxY protein
MGHEFEELSSRILGAAVEVHKALGPGFLESIYQRAMEVALEHRGIAFQRQTEVHVYFDGVDLGIHRLDLIAGEQVILELKAVKALEDIHFAQLRSYLKATGLHTGSCLTSTPPPSLSNGLSSDAGPACLFRVFVLSCFRDCLGSWNHERAARSPSHR